MNLIYTKRALRRLRALKIDISFRRPPPFFLRFKKKVERFSELRGFQKSAKNVNKNEVFTLHVESFCSEIKTCSLTNLA